MKNLLTSRLWVINLGAFALAAYLLGTGYTDYLSARLFLVPAARLDGSASTHARAALLAGRIPPDAAAAAVLGDRRIFWLEPPKRSEAVAAPPAEPEEQVLDEDDGLAETELPVDLLGTVTSSGGTRLATLAVDGKTRLASPGTELLGGKARVVEVDARAVVLEEGGDLRLVHLWGERRTDYGKRASKSRRQRRTPKARAQRGRGRGPWRSAVRRLSTYRYRVDRDKLQQALADGGSGLPGKARVASFAKDGRAHGFKLYGVRADSAYRALGLRSGDVVRAINGREVNSAARAQALFDALARGGTVTLDIERRRRNRRLQYAVQ